jgi:Mn-dependent DtxR family transcriptional regulator
VKRELNKLEELSKEETGIIFIKKYPILKRLKVQTLSVDLIELVLSFQENNQKFYMNYSAIAEILQVSYQSIKDTVCKLKKVGYLKTENTSNFNGVKGGSSTSIYVDIDRIVEDLKNTPTVEKKEIVEDQISLALKEMTEKQMQKLRNRD